MAVSKLVVSWVAACSALAALLVIAAALIVLNINTGSGSNHSGVEEYQTNRVVNGFYLSRIVITNMNGELLSSTEISLNKSERQLYSHFQWHYKPETHSRPDVHSIYEYDERGNWIGFESLEDDKRKLTRRFEYSSNGMLVVEKIKIGNSVSTARYSYSLSGKLIKRVSTNDGSDLTHTHNYEFNNADQLERISAVDWKGRQRDDIEFNYDELGRLTGTKEKIRSIGRVGEHYAYSYNGDGNVSSIVKTYARKNMLGKTEYTYVATDELVFNKVLFDMLYKPPRQF